MYIQTHLLSGWCFGNLFGLTPKERFFCILAAALPDIDGFGFLISNDLYWDYHHLLSHNIFFFIAACGILTFFSQHRLKAFLIFMGLMHLHLVMDYLGSGYGWQIKYFWPVSYWSIWYQKAWPFFGWQNKIVALFFVIWTLAIIAIQKRTFFEWPMPSLDKQIIDLIKKFKR
jgi:inner membrane protein